MKTLGEKETVTALPRPRSRRPEATAAISAAGRRAGRQSGPTRYPTTAQSIGQSAIRGRADAAGHQPERRRQGNESMAGYSFDIIELPVARVPQAADSRETSTYRFGAGYGPPKAGLFFQPKPVAFNHWLRVRDSAAAGKSGTSSSLIGRAHTPPSGSSLVESHDDVLHPVLEGAILTLVVVANAECQSESACIDCPLLFRGAPGSQSPA